MPRYLISFDDGSMDHIPEADQPAVGESAHAVVREAKAAGIWIFGGEVLRQQSSIVATDGTISDGPYRRQRRSSAGSRSSRSPRARRRSCGQLESPRRVDVRKRSARSVLIRSPDHAQRRSDCEA